jgi:hypothetical protein
VSPAPIVRGHQRSAAVKFFRLICVLIGAGLLLLAASCSFQKRVLHDSGDKGKESVFIANAFCSACHYGFAEEDLARTHEQAGIGCERCHGESERHRSDEDNATPPEIMYTKDRINPTCMMCHPRHEIERVPTHQMLLAGAKTALDSAPESDSRQTYCTDCHGKEHRINVRTIRWNKATGERQ